MIIDLTEFEGGPRAFEFTISREEIDLGDAAFRLTSDLRTRGEVTKTAAQTDVKGTIDGSAEIDCTRCLQPISCPLNIDFLVSFVTPEHFASGKDHEVLADDLDTDVLDSDRVDLKEIAREQILLNVPEQTFCKTDCKGLCPKCGADRNLIDCKCDETETDPRWAALKDFRS